MKYNTIIKESALQKKSKKKEGRNATRRDKNMSAYPHLYHGGGAGDWFR